MATIGQIISPLPEAGHRGVDIRTVFVTKQEAFQDALQGTTVTQINNWATQANAVRNEVNGFQASASTSASTATTKASEASASALSASTSASTATTKASEASSSAGVASTQAGIATTKASEASTSASSALSSKNSATTSATNASASASSASTSETTATTQAGIATTKASEASTSASSAQTSLNTLNGILATLSDGSINDTIIGTDKAYSNQKSNQLLDLKANLASPALTGTPTAPTQAVGNNSTRLATTAFVLANDRNTNLTTSTSSTTLTVNSSTGTTATLPAVTTTVAGVMTANDKTKLDGIAAGAQVNVPTNLTAIAGTTAGPTIYSSTGTNVVIPSASATDSGVVTTGAQTFAGVKTFSSFPVTPSSAPSTNYQVANKKYVDDNAGISLATANSYDLGVGQTWQNVTASRSAGVTYTNTTGKPIFINVRIDTTSAPGLVKLFINGIEVDGSSVDRAGFPCGVSSIIPHNSTYQIALSSATNIVWAELR